MNRRQKKKDVREQSTRQLMGIDDFTDYGIATRMGNLVFFAIKPTNISVLPGSGVGARIYALLNVIKGQVEIEMLALNSKSPSRITRISIDSRQILRICPPSESCWSKTAHTWIASKCLWHPAGSFIFSFGYRAKKESDVFSYLSRIEKSIKDNGFTVRRATEQDLKRMLGVYFRAECDHRAVRRSRWRTLDYHGRIRRKLGVAGVWIFCYDISN